MSEELKINCPLCQDSRTFFFRKGTLSYENISWEKFKITDSDYGLFPDLYRCQNCGLTFAHPLPPADKIIKLYSQMEDPEYEQEHEGRGENFRRILKVLSRLRPDKGRLLDVGCATGIFMEIARKWGWEVIGVEPSQWAVSVARSKGLKVFQGDFADVPEEEKYDVITMIDFIEHTNKPAIMLRKAHRLLKKGGVLLIVTPDISSLAAKITGRKWWHLRPGHLCFFRKETIFYLEKTFSFKILLLRHYVWTFSLHYLITRFPFGRKYFNFGIFKKIKLKLPLMDSLEVYFEKLS